MASRSSPDREVQADEEFRLRTVQRFSSDRRRGLNHGMARNERVAEMLCYMALIRDPARRSRSLPANPAVTCTAAIRQFFRATGGEQAAHLLPGQIRIGGVLPWHLLMGPASRNVQLIFAYVDPLQANYNKADSAAEANGLTQAFAQACRHVLAGQGDAAADIGEAFDRIWVAGALVAFAAAEQQKRSRPAPVELIRGTGMEHGLLLNFEERADGFQQEPLARIHDQLSILGYYRAAMDERPLQIQPRAIGAILALPRA